MTVPSTVPQELRERYQELAEKHGGAGYLRLAGVDYLFRRPAKDELLDIGSTILDVTPEYISRDKRVMAYRKLLLTLVDEQQRPAMVGFVNEKLHGEAKTAREGEIIGAADHFLSWLGGDAVVTPMIENGGLIVYVNQDWSLRFRLPSMQEIERSVKHYQVGRVYRGLRELINACVLNREDLEAAVRGAGPFCLGAVYAALVDAFEDEHGGVEVPSAGF